MSGEAVLLPVAPPLLPYEWSDEIAEMIEAANGRLPGDPFDAEKVLADCLASRLQLWLAKRDGEVIGLGITGVERPDDGRAKVHLMLVAGRDWPSWAWMLGPIEDWGRSLNCSVLRILGRRGWGRRLPTAYRLTGERQGAKGFVWEKDLCNG